MNMCWLIFLLIFTVWTTGKMRKKVKSKLIVIQTTDIDTGLRPSRSYTSYMLRSIGTQWAVSQQHRRQVPSFEAIRMIKSLRINKRRIRLSPNERKTERKINLNNLKQIEVEDIAGTGSTRLKFSVVNARSVRNKMTEIQHKLVSNHIDALLITESWLLEKDNIWLNTLSWNKIGYKFDSVPRLGKKKGGGLLLVYHDCFKADRIETDKLLSCESQLWIMDVQVWKFSLLGVYHPPSTSNPIPDSIFIDQLTDLVQDLTLQHVNLIVAGDFNIHINDPGNADAVNLLDAMSALGLEQIIKTATHNSGNTLDHVYVVDPEIMGRVLRCEVSDFLSDHRWITLEFNIRKKKLAKEHVKTRKLVENYAQKIEEFCGNLQLDIDDNPLALANLYDHQLFNFV